MSMLERNSEHTERSLSSKGKGQKDIRPPKEIGETKNSSADIPREIGNPSERKQEIPREINERNTFHPASAHDVDNPKQYTNESERIKTQKETYGNIVVNRDILPNKLAGLEREQKVEGELRNKYPESKGYRVLTEQYLRDKSGNIVKDTVTGEARRIDFVVIDKNGNIVDSIEATSKTADKTEQTAKEERIRANGGNYVRGQNGQLHKLPDNLKTRIERRD